MIPLTYPAYYAPVRSRDESPSDYNGAVPPRPHNAPGPRFNAERSAYPNGGNGPGFTKREAVAVAALQGLLASGDFDVQGDACRAVAYADALLVALDK